MFFKYDFVLSKFCISFEILFLVIKSGKKDIYFCMIYLLAFEILE